MSDLIYGWSDMPVNSQPANDSKRLGANTKQFLLLGDNNKLCRRN